ncbi:hypothetical protein BOTBODRAFT_178119 [Botryobasidium botryosum FD-172 SS1]|uniref:Transmembrane protein n=1 Tax=Botryobasidium botryosum (strain FD-172 SS1) TaxID=930990 RepID=A0A067MFW5_BOTB1|nr:hypothetical protein BOTBODRAFT_178119 [Botryobasidium botryosum FD-172 SS1]
MALGAGFRGGWVFRLSPVSIPTVVVEVSVLECGGGPGRVVVCTESFESNMGFHPHFSSSALVSRPIVALPSPPSLDSTFFPAIVSLVSLVPVFLLFIFAVGYGL